MRNRWTLALVVSFTLLASGCGRFSEKQTQNAVPEQPQGPSKGVDRSHAGQPMPTATFRDAHGGSVQLSDFNERPFLLVNLWATWCAPCVKELPTLQALMMKRQSEIRVLPISQDSGPQPSVEAFLKEKHLDFVAYQDPQMKLSAATGAQVLPTTILYNNGREVWRYVGDLDWTGAEAAKLLSESR